MHPVGMATLDAREFLADFDPSDIPVPNPICSGFPELDEVTGGLFAREIMTFASGDRKLRSSVLQRILWNVAVEQSRNVLYVTSQDAPAYVFRQAILDPPSRDSTGRMAKSQTTKQRLKALKDANPVILSIEKARVDRQIQRLWELCEDRKPDILLLDDVQGCVTSYRDSIYADLSMLSRNLKWLIGVNEIPLVMTSELNRYRHHRENPSDQLYDLRDSGVLEDDSDFVIFLSRSENSMRLNHESTIASIKKSRSGPSNGIVNIL